MIHGEPPTRRRFVGLLGGVLGAMGFVAGASAIAGGGGGGAPTDANYLVGTANPDLSAEIVVGTIPGGELGGTWPSPTVDSIHAGSAHHVEDHRARHVSGGADAFATNDLVEAVVKRLRESAGPTDLLIGAVADGEFIKRSGTSLVGSAPSSPGSLIFKANNATSVGIGGGVGDNKAPLNLASIDGISKVIHEGNFGMVSNANVAFQILFEWHRPDHSTHTAIVSQFRFDATGAGDIFGVQAHIAYLDTAPQVGNYHFNVTTDVGGGTKSVSDHRLIGIV